MFLVVNLRAPTMNVNALLIAMPSTLQNTLRRKLYILYKTLSLYQSPKSNFLLAKGYQREAYMVAHTLCLPPARIALFYIEAKTFGNFMHGHHAPCKFHFNNITHS